MDEIHFPGIMFYPTPFCVDFGDALICASPINFNNRDIRVAYDEPCAGPFETTDIARQSNLPANP